MAPNNMMNTRQAQVIDPILTTQARGYRNAQMIYESMFPTVDIPARSMRVIRFGKDDFRLMQTRRAPGAATRRVTYGFESDPLSLVQDALNAVVPREIANAALTVPGIDMASKSIGLVQNVIELGHEKAAADLVKDVNNYAPGNVLAVSGTDKWMDPSSDPAAQMEDAKLTVAAKTGQEPKIVNMGRDVVKALKKHPKVKDQFKYTGRESITVEMLAAYFDVDRINVGSAVYLPEGADDSVMASFIWSGVVQLCSVNTDGTYLAPSFGYSYRLEGHPIVEQPWWDNDAKSWIYGVTQERAPVVTGKDAGYLIQNVL